MLDAYDPDLRSAAHQAAAHNGITLHEGVYAMVGGPAYETLAEIRFLQRGGADAVGMSTIPEVLVARHERMRVLGISAITDMAVGHDAVHEIAHATSSPLPNASSRIWPPSCAACWLRWPWARIENSCAGCAACSAVLTLVALVGASGQATRRRAFGATADDRPRQQRKPTGS